MLKKIDPTKVFDDIKEQRDRYNRMKPKKTLDTTAVAAFAVSTLCDNPLYVNVLKFHPNKADITSADLKVLAETFANS